MKMKYLYLPVLAATIYGCGAESKFPDFDQTETGLYYQVVEEGDGKQVMKDDIITVDLKYSTDDTLLFDSKNYQFPTQLKVISPAYKGDVMEGFSMMKVGGTSIFKTSADSFFSIIAQVELPPFIDTGSFITFEATVQKAQSIEEIQAEKAAEAEASRSLESGLIEQYLAENNITAKPTESGLYFVETVKGNGKAPQRGQMIKVHYIGRLLTGEKFDASYDRGEPIEFALGSGQVIPGWDEGIGYMTVGGKATMIIPSALAYADRPPPGSIIKPYSPLVFDVELVEAN